MLGDQTSEWVAYGTAIAAIITATVTVIGKFLLDAYKQRQLESKTTRTDTITEWKDWVSHLEARLKVCEEDHKECLRQNADLRIANAELKGDLKLLQSAVQRLQSATGMTPSAMPIIIIADIDGIVRTVSPGVGQLLHYLPGELIGKNIEMLIPEPERPAHRAALAKVKELGQPPWEEKVMLVNALDKEGNLIPVSVTLSSWLGAKGQWYISAEIRKLGPKERGPVMDVLPRVV